MPAVPVHQLHPHPLNPRTDLGDLSELALSIREQGILQPLLVEPRRGGGFQILIGHRRAAAAVLAGLAAVPCMVADRRERAAAVETMLVENIQRRALTPLEQANAYDALRNLGHTVADVARRTGATPATVAARLALLELPEEAQLLLAQDRIGVVAATSLARQVRRSRTGEVRASRARTHLDRSHPLGEAARLRCDLAGHPQQGRLGGTACGRCWEQQIRADERGESVLVRRPRAVDEVVVARVADGERLELTTAERERVVAVLHARGLSDGGITAATGIPTRTVLRVRQRLGLPAQTGLRPQHGRPDRAAG